MTQEQQTVFHHVVLKGDAYQIGRVQGEAIKNTPGFVGFLCSGAGKFSAEEFKRISAQMEQFTPTINEEMRGMADAIGIDAQDLIYYSFSYLHQGHCSHFALLPSRTEEGRVLVGRSYEFGLQTEDLRLVTMQVDGKYAFIGSSLLFFGFTEGMNEHGLTVTMSAGGWPVGPTKEMRPPIRDGFQFWFVVRAVLENCKTVDEAVRLIMEIPTCGNPNIIVADKSGSAALVEVFGGNKAVKMIDADSEEQFLCSTNHFTLPEMMPYRDPVWQNSQVRYDAIRAQVDGTQKVGKESMRLLLSQEYPRGLACHYYEEGFGTLRSMIFDPQALELEMCFGSPVEGEWHAINFNTPGKSYPVRMRLEKMPADFMTTE